MTMYVCPSMVHTEHSFCCSDPLNSRALGQLWTYAMISICSLPIQNLASNRPKQVAHMGRVICALITV